MRQPQRISNSHGPTAKGNSLQWEVERIKGMTDKLQNNLEYKDVTSPDNQLSDGQMVDAVAGGHSLTTKTLQADSQRSERRRLIRSAIASVPVVLTFTAGHALATGPSVKNSSLNTPPPEELEVDPPALKAGEEEESTELTPAEKLETFGLQRSADSDTNSEDPFRDLDTVHDNP